MMTASCRSDAMIDEVFYDPETGKYYTLCQSCKYYDTTPYPEYDGRLARCSNPHSGDIGAGKIGRFTMTCKFFEHK